MIGPGNFRVCFLVLLGFSLGASAIVCGRSFERTQPHPELTSQRVSDLWASVNELRALDIQQGLGSVEAVQVLCRDLDHAHTLAADATVDQEVLRQQVSSLRHSLAELSAYSKITGADFGCADFAAAAIRL